MMNRIKYWNLFRIISGEACFHAMIVINYTTVPYDFLFVTTRRRAELRASTARDHARRNGNSDVLLDRVTTSAPSLSSI